MNQENVNFYKETQNNRINAAKQNYKEGTVILVKTNFNTKTLYTSVEVVEIIDDFVNNIEKINWLVDECFVNNCFENVDCYVINCFESVDCCDFSNDFVYPKKEVKSGDTVYVVTSNDGDPYGTLVLGVFTEKPDKDELIKKYNEYLKNLDEEYGDFPEYIASIFEVVVE